MKKILFAAALVLAPSAASATCSGVFQPGTICGNNSASPKIPFEIPGSTGLVGPGSSTVGDLALWNNITGSALKDQAPAALTGANDTNVTLTMGGNASTALVNAASVTAGWTGTLAAGRLNANVVQSVVNDTNVTGSIATQALTLGWTGTLSSTRGGSGANNSASTGFATWNAGVLGSVGASATVLPIANGGTGQATKSAAVTALLPTTSLPGDIIYWNGSAWVILAGNSSGTQVLQEDASGVPSWATIAGTGTVTSVTPGAGIVSAVTANCSQAAVTTTGTLFSAECVNAQTGTTYTFVDGDRATLVTGANAAAQAYALPQAGTASEFMAGWWTEVENLSTLPVAAITITPATSTICGGATLVLYPGESVKIVSDGTNYQCAYYKALNGPWHLLNVLTASNSASLSDATSITSAFTEYEVVLENILPASGSISLEFQVKVSTFQTASYVSSALSGSGAAAASSSLTSGVLIGAAAGIPATAPGVSGRYLLSNPGLTLTCKMIHGDFSYLNTSVFTGTSAGCYNGGNGAITGIQLLATAGNLTSGVMKIYGRVK